MRTQTMVQLNEALIQSLDARAARDGLSRSRLIRDAVEAYLVQDAEAAALQRIVDGYARHPETKDELRVAARDARSLVEEEPW